MNEARLPFHPRIGDQLERRRSAGIDHVPYVYSDELIVAVNAALATDRPLLLRGEPGCGKSTLARDVAFALGREYYEEVVTSRTTAVDLQWRFDAVHRLSDAADSRSGVDSLEKYIRPGVLWRAFKRSDSGRHAVVLLDEIDKADPDVPNDLLLPLGENRLVVTDTTPSTRVERERDVLVVITTNGERELPPAFLRRCVSLTLDDPSKHPELLHEIAVAHLDRERARNRDVDLAALPLIVERVAELNAKLAFGARRSGTAEILDALKATAALGIAADDPDWATLTRVLLYKEGDNPDAAEDPAT